MVEVDFRYLPNARFYRIFFLINNPLRTNLPSLILMLRRKENGINSLSAFR